MLEVLAEDNPGETRVALLRDGILDEYYLHRPGAPDGVGDVHWARVTACVPAMAGAFVALQDREAFLPDSDGARALGVGDHLVVRVTRAAQGGKGPRVAAAPDAAPEPGPVRLLARGPSPLQELRAAFPAAPLRVAAFTEALDNEIDALGAPQIELPGGMCGTITPTPALTAIDLDGGSSTAARGGKATLQFAANRAALPELARQIRLRNLSGAILVDFAGVSSRRRAALGEGLQAALAADRLAPRLLGFSAFGFAEIQRIRRRPPLHERLVGPHAAGLLALRRAGTSAAARLVLRAAPTVIAALQDDTSALAQVARIRTYPLLLRSDATLRPGTWIIEPDIA
jgi:Ribonuclease G/E